MTQKKNRIPKFKSRQEMAQWWDTHNVADYLDELKPVDIKFDLEKPKEEVVMFRLDKGVKQYLAQLARSKGLNTSSLLRMWIMERFNQINHT
jgi:hypothetical protein